MNIAVLFTLRSIFFFFFFNLIGLRYSLNSFRLSVERKKERKKERGKVCDFFL